jgi:hypothetical protein
MPTRICGVAGVNHQHAVGQVGLPTDESACQIRLDAFRQRNNMVNILPEMKHGATEGVIDRGI